MKYFSCFSGIGGFELGIINAYANNVSTSTLNEYVMIHDEKTRPMYEHIKMATQQPTCVGFSEIDKYATQIYKSHFPNHKEYGDITKINTDELPDFDCLIGGFPCQAFSIAGKRKGFEDTRGTLFFELARILQAKQPRLFVFENVKGLLSHDNGKTFSTIIATIDELGYDCQWQVLNSKNHGVPQNRERVYIVGHLRGTPRPKVFPITRENKEPNSTEQKENKPVVPTMLGEHRTELGKQTRREIRKSEGRDSTLRGAEHKEYRPNSHQLANCITTGEGVVEKWLIDTDIRIRRLTPVECERLQGFPDNWTAIVSDTQRYKCCGNAVTTNVVRDIFIEILGKSS